MANLLISSLSRGTALSRTFGCHVLVRTAPATALVSKENISTTAIAKREYGPIPKEEQVDELQHWTNERYVVLALIPIIPAALAYPNPVLDTALVSAMVLHTHWRLSGVSHDYIHGPILHPLAKYTVLFLSIATFGSLCYFNYFDVGFAGAARMIYSQL